MTRGLVPAVLLLVLCGVADAQPATKAPAAPADAPRAAAPSGVVRPPANVDPGIRVTPRPTARLPTPVIRPRPDQGDTVVVPK